MHTQSNSGAQIPLTSTDVKTSVEPLPGNLTLKTELSTVSAAEPSDPAPPLQLSIPATKNPAVTIHDPTQDPNATVISGSTLPAPAAVINNDTGNEINADPDNPIPKPGDVRSSDKELGPTWFDALLLAIRSGTMLGSNLMEKAINEGNELYKQRWEANQQRLKDLDKVETELRAAHEEDPNKVPADLADQLEKAAQTTLTELDGIQQDDGLPKDSVDCDNINSASTTITSELPKAQPTLDASKLTHTTPSPAAMPSLSTAPKPSGPSEAAATETPAEKKAREAAALAAKKTVEPTGPTLTSAPEFNAPAPTIAQPSGLKSALKEKSPSATKKTVTFAANVASYMVAEQDLVGLAQPGTDVFSNNKPGTEITPLKTAADAAYRPLKAPAPATVDPLILGSTAKQQEAVIGTSNVDPNATPEGERQTPTLSTHKPK